MKTTLETWYQENMSDKQNYLKEDEWCLGNQTLYFPDDSGKLLIQKDFLTAYGSATYRLDENYMAPTLKCSNNDEKLNSYIGTLTADEVAYAGAIDDHIEKEISNDNSYFYIRDNAKSGKWYTLTMEMRLIENASIYSVYENTYGSALNFVYSSDEINLRPAITLKTGTEVTGQGTLTDPYKIK